MNKKSIIGLLFVGALTFMTSSCADMFDISSSRVVYDNQHKLDSSADSVYTTIGILHAFQQIADRYVILGEVRGDMVDINKNTKASLRNLAEFNFDEDNEYLQIRDYYKVINNCNYLIAHMDTTIRHNNESVMTDEYVAALSIRAWTYMQMALNYGKVTYYTNPITKESDADVTKYPSYDVKELALVLIPQLLPYMEYKLPAWSDLSAGGTAVSAELFPPIQLILGDLYLWLGDYQNAWLTYNDFITDNPNYSMRAQTGSETTIFTGFMPLGNGQVMTDSRMTGRSYMAINFPSYTSGLNGIMGANKGEAITVVPMQSSTEEGTVSEIPGLFMSAQNTHQLNGSALWQEISSAQDYVQAAEGAQQGINRGYSYLSNKGDQRINFYVREVQNEEDEFEVVSKFVSSTRIVNNTDEQYSIGFLTLYRRGLVYLRAAEALNCLAEQQHDGAKAIQAFGILRDGFDILFPNGSTYKAELQPYTLGVHARGSGDVYLDTARYVVKDAVIAEFYGKEVEDVNFTDTIHYVEDRICDELALETTLEGNRFTDLVRFAQRRGADYLAGKVACRKGTENRDEALYQKLLNKANWYLPIK